MFQCSNCGNKKYRHKLELGKQPIVHHLIDDKNEGYNLYDLAIVTCEKCAHLQIKKPFDPKILYENYFTFSSWKNNQHVSLLINKMTSLFNLNFESKIFEIGCNDGHMLGDLKKIGYKNLFGIEPTKDAFSLAEKKVKNVYNDFFSKNFLKKKKLKNFDLIYSRHVFEHLYDLNGVLEAAHLMLKKNGNLMIEVPMHDMYFENCDYTFWEEHVNYFTKNSLFNLLSRNKFRIFHYETTLFSGKSIIIFAEKYNKRIKYFFNLSNEHKRIKKYFEKFLMFKKNLHNFLKSMNKKPFIYGCGCRSSNFVNFLNIGKLVECFVDDNYNKQNKINPGNLLEIRKFDNNNLKNRAVFLAVNSENEGVMIQRLKKYFKIKNIFSILPPSRILPLFWKNMIDKKF
jgi:SAM-dependent methyltransferase